MQKGMKIGEFARRLGINAKTVRYYEALGLLQAAERSEAGYRVYFQADEGRMRFVLGAKALGLSLAEIGEILEEWSGGSRPCDHVTRLLNHKLAALDHRIAELTRFRSELATYMERVASEALNAEVPCVHIQGVEEGRWPVAEVTEPPNSRPPGRFLP